MRIIFVCSVLPLLALVVNGCPLAGQCSDDDECTVGNLCSDGDCVSIGDDGEGEAGEGEAGEGEAGEGEAGEGEAGEGEGEAPVAQALDIFVQARTGDTGLVASDVASVALAGPAVAGGCAATLPTDLPADGFTARLVCGAQHGDVTFTYRASLVPGAFADDETNAATVTVRYLPHRHPRRARRHAVVSTRRAAAGHRRPRARRARTARRRRLPHGGAERATIS